MAEGSSYSARHRARLEEFQSGLSDNIAIIVSMRKDQAGAVLAYLLELACQTQSVYNIMLGRNALAAIPHDWLLEQVEIAAEPLVRLDQEYEYRRLLELYELLDAQLLGRLVERGLRSGNTEVREAAEDFLDRAG